MEQVLEGKCQCGGITYRVTGEVATLFACHCTECQRQSSSAFGMALWIKDPQVKVLTGKLKEWTRSLPSGRQMSCQFCPDCGTRLFHQTLGQTQFMSIKPGTLNDTSWLQPVGHIWTQSKQTWVALAEGTVQCAGNPDSFDVLLDAWATQNDK